ncbi:MAG: polysaccharide biosynthesis tyrosine autokinase [Actinomycetota bacterium]|nr:polysaccharide biosynthesis tyrosine autokinase [Actinomycetota bacterium]
MGAENSPLTGLNRRKWLIIATVAVAVLTAAIASQLVDKVYGTSSTLLVALNSDSQSFDTVQASQAIARSYADIIESPNIAADVAEQLGAGTTRNEIKSATSFETVPETQLLLINAEAATPERAKEIADAYASVFINYARTSLGDTTQASITRADAAPLSGSPSRPKPKLYVAVAAILGLALGLALALLRERLDRRLRTPEDVEAHFDVPVLARIPRRRRSEKSSTAFMEAYRILRTNLQFAAVEQELRTVVVTSAREGEGKTTTVANLAVTSAEVGVAVLVVEADLRRPALQAELMPSTPELLRPGFSNYLVEASSIGDSIHQTGRPGVSILPAGPLPPTSPSALLEAGRGRTTVDVLRGEADLVIFDCPPLNVSADASILADRVDGVILVVDLLSSTEHTVRQALQQLEAVRAPLLGIVINRDRSATPSSYGYYTAGTPSPSRAKTEQRGKVAPGSIPS